MHLGQVLFVLHGGGSAKTDGVAKVEGAQAGHDGIQIDDAHGAAGFVVDEDVVELCIVVGDAQGQIAALQLVHQGGAEGFVGQRHVDQVAHAVGAAGEIVFHSGAEVAEAIGRVVESGDGLVQAGGVKVVQHGHEAAESTAGFAEHGGVFHQVVAAAFAHEGVGAPVVAVGVDGAQLAVFVLEHAQGAALGVAAHSADALAQVMGHALDVFHDLQRLGEDVLVDALQHELGTILALEQIGIIDMPAAKSHRSAQRMIRAEGSCERTDVFNRQFHKSTTPV